ncbi:sugar phosphate isomerase/epimerase [Candidatus Bathyarchaeota archaeon]|nr:sugar phosphate isomerase/epimerase [Candidatus Bathyarchaeota archaeon]
MTRPKIGLSMLYCLSQPFKKMIQQIPKQKTAYIELVDDGLHELNKQRTNLLKDIKTTYNLRYSVHAPFGGVNISIRHGLLSNATMKRLKKSIVWTQALDSYLWIFHPGMMTGISMFYPGADWKRNINRVRLLARFARDIGVEIALENVMGMFVMKNVDDFKKFYSETGENIGIALDTGHANINGQLENFLAELPHKIVHVHAHDNDGKSDNHLGIGYGTINWKSVANLLQKASYGRTIIVESVANVEQSIQKLEQLFS